MITRSWLSGAGMINAQRAVNLGLKWHEGTRKDGITPEFTHQLSQIQYIRSLAGINDKDREIIICCIAMHDLPEDKKYNISNVYYDFGQDIGLGVERLSKKYFGENAEQSNERYYYDIARNKYAALVKGGDRCHNQLTMIGVLPHMFEYIKETEDFVLPMLKEARKLFPEYDVAYTALRNRLKEQNHLIKAAYDIGMLHATARLDSH